MKVFFYAPEAGQSNFNNNYEQINNFLNFGGYQNINQKKPTKKSGSNHYQYLLDQLVQSDLCIFECSQPQLETGLLIEKALEISKPIIVLYLEGCQPGLLSDINNEKLQLIKYNKNNLIDLLKLTVAKASMQTDKRFNFFISSELLNYLNNISQKQGITKSTFIRNLILEHMRQED